MEIVRVENLSKVYGKGNTKVVALDNVSFSVEQGEFVAIVGASGSGKSTLLHLIGGVDRPTSGKVFVGGKNIYELELLRFNLKDRKWIIRKPNEFYLLSRVSGSDIEYLRIYNKKSGIYLPLDLLYPTYNKEISWNHLKGYKPLIRRKEL